MSQEFINNFAQFSFTFVFIIAFRLLVLRDTTFEKEMHPGNLLIIALSAVVGMFLANLVLA